MRFSSRNTALVSIGCLVAGLFIAGCGKKEAPASDSPASPAGTGNKVVVAMLPKLINIDYFDACKRGAQKLRTSSG
jgi:hypothetical protein